MPYRPQYANDECGRGTRGAWGANTTPRVYTVSNLNDSGDGSLRQALEASEPRVVIFSVGGAIINNGDYIITNPYCTVAGQTAPSPGITIQGNPNGSVSSGGLSITTHDVVIQHIRIRPGDCPPVLSPTAAHDALAMYYEGVYNVVIDHCSVSWAGGKNMQSFGIAENAGVSFWKCICAEALYYAANVDYSLVAPGNPSSLGVLLANNYNNKPASFAMVGCLMAHCSDRNPEIQGPVSALIVNNVFYDWGRDETNYQWGTFICSYDGALGPMSVDIIGNVYIAGNPSIGMAPPFTPLYAVGTWGLNPGSQIHIHDNVLDGVELFDLHAEFDPLQSSPCSGLSYPSIEPSANVFESVLAHAGARPLNRDAVDARIVNQVKTKTGTVIRSQNEVGGWSNSATLDARCGPPVTTVPPGPDDEAGYKNWLEQQAIALEEGNVVEPPPGELEGGYEEEGEPGSKPPVG